MEPCKVCGNPILDTRRRVVCSKECSLIRHASQLSILSEARRRKPVERACTICGETFLAKAPNQVYCFQVRCKAEGLKRAIDRQRYRRLTTKEGNGP